MKYLKTILELNEAKSAAAIKLFKICLLYTSDAADE